VDVSVQTCVFIFNKNVPKKCLTTILFAARPVKTFFPFFLVFFFDCFYHSNQKHSLARLPTPEFSHKLIDLISLLDLVLLPEKDKRIRFEDTLLHNVRTIEFFPEKPA